MASFLVPVRYGLMATTESFLSPEGDYLPGDVVIIRGERGVDYGMVDSAAKAVDREVKGLGEVVRRASDEDLRIIQHIREVREPEELAYCKECIQSRKLPMKLAGLEHLFGGDKVVFYFLSDGRVDFRELVKDLARRYRMRIEMRQIGVRDEARMLSDYEHCGRELCCRTFLRKLDPVTMRMAKMQKTTLDPNKISGHCGRLMCCLRFEDVVYTQNKNELPKKGEIVATPTLEGIVINANILTQMVTISTRGGDHENIHLSEIVERKGRAPAPQGASGGAAGGHGGKCGENCGRSCGKDQRRSDRPERGENDKNRDRNRDRDRNQPRPDRQNPRDDQRSEQASAAGSDLPAGEGAEDSGAAQNEADAGE